MKIRFFFLLAAVMAFHALALASDAAPTANDLLALEKQLIETSLHGDSSFFSRTLSDKAVMPDGDGGRIGVADLVKLIKESQCSVRDGSSLTQPVFQKINADAYALTYLLTEDRTCIFMGTKDESKKPARVSSLWVRSGDQWKLAYQNQKTVVDPQTMIKDPALADQKLDMTKTGSADADTAALMVAENAIWDARKNKDAKRLAALTAAEISYVNIFGDSFASKADVLKSWTGDLCQMNHVSLLRGVGTLVAPAVAVLTVSGSIDGNCGGLKLPPVYATSVYVKQGESWKWAFGSDSVPF